MAENHIAGRPCQRQTHLPPCLPMRIPCTVYTVHGMAVSLPFIEALADEHPEVRAPPPRRNGRPPGTYGWAPEFRRRIERQQAARQRRGLGISQRGNYLGRDEKAP